MHAIGVRAAAQFLEMSIEALDLGEEGGERRRRVGDGDEPTGQRGPHLRHGHAFGVACSQSHRNREPRADFTAARRLGDEAGALGIGSSLIYPPAFFASTEELEALQRECRRAYVDPALIQYAVRLVAASAPPGLEPSAPPSIERIPNNHRSYALQWFLFALIAAVIYVLALRKKLKDEAKKP